MNTFTQLTFKLFKCPKFNLEAVFTPSKAAETNYITRAEIDEILSSEMSTPGKQLIVYGHSGCGKTSSVRNLLKKNKYKFIKTHCETNTTFEQIIFDAFDELDVFVQTEKLSSISSEVIAEYKSIKSQLAQHFSLENTSKYSRILPPQLSPQKLAQVMGRGEINWIIEDFHKVSNDEKRRIADIMKIFVDNANDYPLSKIICIGACQSAHELVELDPNLRTRVSEISIPLLKDEEIQEIITNGFKLLNVKPSNSLVEKLVYYSDRLGAMAHQMCMDICKASDIEKTSSKTKELLDDRFECAVEAFIKRSSDTFKTIYEAAVKNSLGCYILKAFGSGDTMDKLSLQTIYNTVNKEKTVYEIQEIEDKLKELMNPSFNIIYFNSKSETYALTTPFWHRFLRLQFSIEKKQRNRKKLKANLITNDIKYQTVDKLMFELLKDLKKYEKYI